MEGGTILHGRGELEGYNTLSIAGYPLIPVPGRGGAALQITRPSLKLNFPWESDQEISWTNADSFSA